MHFLNEQKRLINYYSLIANLSIVHCETRFFKMNVQNKLKVRKPLDALLKTLFQCKNYFVSVFLYLVVPLRAMQPLSFLVDFIFFLFLISVEMSLLTEFFPSCDVLALVTQPIIIINTSVYIDILVGNLSASLLLYHDQARLFSL